MVYVTRSFSGLRHVGVNTGRFADSADLFMRHRAFHGFSNGGTRLKGRLCLGMRVAAREKIGGDL